jgi:hypothetical protein
MKKILKVSEKTLHRQVCEYLKKAYPKVIFNTDMAGIKLSIGQAKQVKNLRSSNAFPDIAIYESSKGIHGLFLELKSDCPYKKSGELKTDAHLKEQEHMLIELAERGYLAFFAWEFQQAKMIIDSYLK